MPSADCHAAATAVLKPSRDTDTATGASGRSSNNVDGESLIDRSTPAHMFASVLQFVEAQQSSLNETGIVNVITPPEVEEDLNGRRHHSVFDSYRRWEQITDTVGTGPGKRSLHVSAMRDSGSCLVFGGFDGSSRTNHMFTYTFATKTWRQVIGSESEEVPSPRDRHTGVMYDGGFYVFGGYDGDQRVNDFFRFDCTTEQWSRMPATTTADTPSPRHSHAAAVHKDSMYVFGGYDGTYRNDLHEFNFTTAQWTRLPFKGRVPRCRYRTTLVVHNDHLFMFGGHDGSRHLNEVHSFSLETKSWALVHTDGNAPTPRDSHVACVHDRAMYIFGGSNGSAMNDLHKLDLTTCKWEALTTRGGAPSPRFCHAAVKYDEKLYMLGGYNGYTRLDDFFSYSFVPSSGHTVSRASIRSDLKAFVNNKEFSDVTFVVQGVELYAHKMICARCPFFSAMFQTGMKESEPGARIALPEVELETFLLLLEYLYTDQVDLTIENAVDVFVLADRFSVERLQKLCENALIRAIRVSNAAQLLLVADFHRAARLRDNCMLFIVRHFDTVSRTLGFEEMGRENYELLLEVLHAR
jgi:N-acetylneuraminic acid mutarotase